MESQLIQSSPDILSGTPVFYGSRVPVQTLIDYIEAGESASHTLRERLDDFLEDFPTVSHAQTTAFLKLALKAEGKCDRVNLKLIADNISSLCNP
ncbi:DUF433 domain-containing protein [Nostoc sp. UCD121]|uniref:DUF433 domain-containing protein n=1 Tax=unclassified Nostoc TaxID=2593658 RepID=UPI001629B508|nr:MULTISPECIES: DUF433 domain-containing protein [unclassified Nostoc]MBC1222033.1 DUF433 domain-containing protein [Nostoc sp. UCD120]MBC1275914.1 DUF433 domain-containing protein [Nostoc sp. UCD121]MBC1293624.1 DUF433 domain-containing protein [Nostoc sp. UCD122]